MEYTLVPIETSPLLSQLVHRMNNAMITPTSVPMTKPCLICLHDQVRASTGRISIVFLNSPVTNPRSPQAGAPERQQEGNGVKIPLHTAMQTAKKRVPLAIQEAHNDTARLLGDPPSTLVAIAQGKTVFDSAASSVWRAMTAIQWSSVWKSASLCAFG